MSGFRDIVGHESTVEPLKTAIASGKVSHAYLIVGDKGMGKRTLARAFSEALQCEDLHRKLEAENSSVSADGGEETSSKYAAGTRLPLSEIDSCGECRSCRQAETGNQPDIITWTYQKNTSISVDDIRRLVSDVYIKPYASGYKIYILPDAQKMTREAQNALLKTLEEPPEYAVLILLSTSRDSMLETVLSRCVVLPLKPVESGKVKKYLMERYGIADDSADIFTAFAQGNIGRAVSLGTSETFMPLFEKAMQILVHVKEWDVSDIIVLLRDIDRGKDAIGDTLDLFTLWYRDVLLFKATRDPDILIFRKQEQIVKIREAAQRSSYEGIQNILNAIRNARVRLSANVSFDLTMELLLLTMKEN